MMGDWASYGRFANRLYGAGLEIYCWIPISLGRCANRPNSKMRGREGGCQGGSAFWNKLQAIFILIIKIDGF